MMIRMVVTKANSRDNLNCDFDDRYYDEADDGDGPTLNGSGSPSLNRSLARWLLASQVSRRSGLYYQHLLVYIYKIIKGWCRRKRRFAKVLVFVTGQTSYLHRHSYRGKNPIFSKLLPDQNVGFSLFITKRRWSEKSGLVGQLELSAVVITQSKLFYQHGHDHRGHDRMQQTHQHQQH